MIVIGNRIYGRCSVCGNLVQENKVLFGSLHICLSDEEIARRAEILSRSGRQEGSVLPSWYSQGGLGGSGASEAREQQLELLRNYEEGKKNEPQ